MKKLLAALVACLPFTAHASYDFDGTNDNLSRASALFTAYPFTVCGWSKMAISAGDSIFAIGTAGTVDNSWQIVTIIAGTPDTVGVRTRTTTEVDTQATNDHNDGAWNFQCIVAASSASVSIFLNGTLTTGNPALTPSAGNETKFGETNADGLDFTGSLGQWAAWDVALAETDLDDLYNGGTGGTNGVNPQDIDPTNLIAYWPMTADATDAIGSFDFTANGNATFDGADNPPVDAPGGAANPDFDSGPTLNNCDADSCDFDYDANADADNIHGMCLSTAEATPTAAAIEAHTGSNGHASEAATGAADTITVPLNVDSPVFPLYNCHFAAEEGTSNYSAVVSVLAVQMAAPTGRNFWPILSIGALSPCADFNTAADPDIAANDWLLGDETTDPGAFVLTVANTCQFEYTDPSGGRETLLNTAVYDASVGGWHASDIDFVANDPDVVCDDNLIEVVHDVGVSLGAGIDLDDFCSNGLDQLTYTQDTGALTAGYSFNGATGVIGGTPSAEDEDGNSVIFEAAGPFGKTDVIEGLFYPIDTWTMPDLDGQTASEAADTVCLEAPWRCDDLGFEISAMTCDEGTAGLVLTQDPAALAEIEPLEEITVTLSRACSLGRRRLSLGIGMGIP